MSLRSLSLDCEYTAPDDGILKLYNTLLKHSVTLKRATGFFSSSVFSCIGDGIFDFIKNDGKIQLITSVRLSKDDFEAIRKGYELKYDNIPQLEYLFEIELSKFNDDNLKLLAKLVATGNLDIKISIPTVKNIETSGIYHDKASIFTDDIGDTIVYRGSANDSGAALTQNYEKVILFNSWDDSKWVEREKSEFDDLWNDNHKFCKTYEFTEATSRIVKKEVNKRGLHLNDNGMQYDASGISLRKYQCEAIQAWKDNNFVGFYVMATGTGKTITALYGVKELLKVEPIVLPIVIAPYIHLVSQWAEDVARIFPDYKIIEISSENPKWKSMLSVYRDLPEEKIFIISTIDSYLSKDFITNVNRMNKKRVLIVDEAHNYVTKISSTQIHVDYKLGLSATPSFGKNIKKSQDLLNFFGGVVYKYDIEDAITNGYLVKYYYNPYYVIPSDEEEEEFNIATAKMASLIEPGGKIKNPEAFSALSSQRHRIIANIQDKIDRLSDIVDFAGVKSHMIIYCGDSKSISGTDNEVMSYLDKVYDKLTEKRIRTNKFTAKEDKAERAKLVDLFNKEIINCLTAIKCLDEGINIKSIQTAIILSSANNYREYVQRRGRILRTCDGKKFANIVDVISLPSTNCQGMAKIELRRFYEYARLAINKDELFEKLAELLVEYNLTFDDLKIDFTSEEEVI